MTFSAEAWLRNRPLYDAIRDMPFNAELAAGTLSPAAFRHFIVQDGHYLVAFAQALAIAAAKAPDPDYVAQFARAAVDAIASERGLHSDYFSTFGLDAATVSDIDLSPTCHHYTSFLLATAFREPLPVLLAALLPCFWIYREVGRHIVGQARSDNPYRAWIDTYAGQAFSDAVDAMLASTDAIASTESAGMHGNMHKVFTRAVQLEWMFWDAAFRCEEWPLQL